MNFLHLLELSITYIRGNPWNNHPFLSILASAFQPHTHLISKHKIKSMMCHCQILYSQFKMHYNYLAMWDFRLLLLVIVFQHGQMIQPSRFPLMNPSKKNYTGVLLSIILLYRVRQYTILQIYILHVQTIRHNNIQELCCVSRLFKMACCSCENFCNSFLGCSCLVYLERKLYSQILPPVHHMNKASLLKHKFTHLRLHYLCMHKQYRTRK